MENNKTLTLAIALIMLLFIVGIGALAIYSGFAEDSEEYELQQPSAIVINNYATKDPSQTKETVTARENNYIQQPSQERPEITYINVHTQGYSYPVYPYYQHTSKNYYPRYPRYYNYPYRPIYANDAATPYYNKQRYYSGPQKRIYF